MMHKIYLLSGLLIAALVSCTNPDKGMVNAIVVNSGDISNANEACGYLLQLDDSSLIKPEYLPSAYQHANYPVKVKYSYTGIQDTCNYGPKIYNTVAIEKIKRNLD